MPDMILPRERIQAVLLAGAAGDGIGGRFEGQTADPERVLPPLPWRVSDDTRLTFATCRGIASKWPIDVAVIADKLVEEFRVGLPGVGSSTLKALRDLAAGQHWALSGARGEFSAGNGAAMRIAPLAFYGDVRDPVFVRLVRDVASVTHRNEEAIAGALAVLSAMQYLAVGRSKTDVLAALMEHLPDTALSDSLAALAKLPHDASALEAASTVGASGRAAESVALAVFIGCSENTVETAIVDAVRCGGDTDTIASLAGQMRAAAGAELPSEWWPHLPIEEVSRLAVSLAHCDARQTPRRRWRLF